MYTYDIEQLLKDGSAIQLKPQGYSMYPLFHPGRDEAIIEAYPIDQLRRGDVILYRRDQGILVLHRICRITSDGFYLVGDYGIASAVKPLNSLYFYCIGSCAADICTHSVKEVGQINYLRFFCRIFDNRDSVCAHCRKNYIYRGAYAYIVEIDIAAGKLRSRGVYLAVFKVNSCA